MILVGVVDYLDRPGKEKKFYLKNDFCDGTNYRKKYKHRKTKKYRKSEY
jgi:hypothetical protein